LVHRSYLNEADELSLSASNERLEFLGDAVLGMLIADELYRRFPDSPEGQLTEMRALLVRNSTLAQIGERLQLGQLLVLGRGEERTGGRNRAPNLGRALEALIGAIYMDADISVVREVVLQLFESDLAQLTSSGSHPDAKSSLQQYVHATLAVTPEYVTVATEGPAHAPEFTVEVRVRDAVAGVGHGRSKSRAQQEAAANALRSLIPTPAGAGPSEESSP
jgi:ribonuclease-3